MHTDKDGDANGHTALPCSTEGRSYDPIQRLNVHTCTHARDDPIQRLHRHARLLPFGVWGCGGVEFPHFEKKKAQTQ